MLGCELTHSPHTANRNADRISGFATLRSKPTWLCTKGLDQMTKAWALPAVLVSAVVLAGCSSSKAADPSTAGSGATSDAGVQAAKAYLATVSGNPKDIVLNKPLSKKPDTGKLVVKLVTAQPVTEVVSKGAAAAAAALGWQYKAIPVGQGAEDIQKAFKAALELQPAPVGIEVSGYPKVTYAAQLAEAKAKGIAVISESATDPAGSGDGIAGQLDGPSQVQIWGKDIAAEVVADSNGKAHVAMFSVSAFPILDEFVKGFKSGLSEWCPACTVKDVDQKATDVGTKTPQSVVSTFQRDPKLNYAIFSFGDLTIGLNAALKSAGLSGKVKIAGETATAANLQGVKDGSELAWTGFSSGVLGWRVVDGFARHSIGDDMTPTNTTPLPTQVITKDNVGSIITDSGGYYTGLNDYESQFKKLWLVN
jgi:ribose transport system substrate-binding protein